MDTIGDWLQLAGFALTVFGGLWALNKSIQRQFTEMQETQQKNHHETDVRLTRIDTTVSPYAYDIQQLKENQQKNMIQIAELKGLDNRVMKLERQVETLQNQR